MKKLLTALILAVIVLITGCSADNVSANAETDIDKNDNSDLINPPLFESEPETEPDLDEIEAIAESSDEIIVDTLYPETEIPSKEAKLIELIPAEKSPDPELLPHPDDSAKIIRIVPDMDKESFAE